MYSSLFFQIIRCLAIVLLMTTTVFAEQTRVIVFCGGPIGSTAQVFADALTSVVASIDENTFFTAENSQGSIENISLLKQHKANFGIITMADAYMARNGKLSTVGVSSQNARAVAYLYNTPAQLIVDANSNIKTVNDLAGKRIAIGTLGSGDAEACKRFLRHIGLWKKITPVSIGYAKAADAFTHGEVDAFWVMDGYPTISIVNVTRKRDIRLLDLDGPARKSGFYRANSYYSPTSIPGGTYRGQIMSVPSFGTVTYVFARADTPDDIVYRVTQDIYSHRGIRQLEIAHKAAFQTLVEDALLGCIVPIHPGAKRFYESIGLPIPGRAQP
ncbi:TAXI family TRAP transporter solute-binding subunit [Desulfovibrio inopinatus]|uniref:TAXI family TRAP transporter solute-binding subunit n=1 Tax=Desulfovibrio inopinatus TaxID=102109 RepID=UPI0003FFC15F|nr:TAXI family TRAP transporter solute-binding subunit [Desulfovibrio inopinatus]